MDPLGPFKRKHCSPSDMWLQNVIRTPRMFGFFPITSSSDCSQDQPSTDKSKRTDFDHQTYARWKAVYEMQKVSHPMRTRRRILVIQPLVYTLQNTHLGGKQNAKNPNKEGGSNGVSEDKYPTEHTLDPFIFEILQEFCGAFFCNMEVMIACPLQMFSHRIRSRVHPTTNSLQLHAEDVFKYMLKHTQIKAMVTVGVVNTDLYPGEEWNFSLGHASTNKGCGVFSIGHYHDQRQSEHVIDRGDKNYQLSRMWRLLKVITHETCHMFGMTHCLYFECLMNESDSVSLAESQPLFLCPVCLRKLRKVLKFDIRSRYELICQQLVNLQEMLINRSVCDCSSTMHVEARGSQKIEPMQHCMQLPGEEERGWKKPDAPSEHVCQLRFIDAAVSWLKGHVL